MTVAPLTMTVLGDADENNAGIASGINNAVARVAGLLAVAALGAIIAARFDAVVDARPDPRRDGGRGRLGVPARDRHQRRARRARRGPRARRNPQSAPRGSLRGL